MKAIWPAFFLFTSLCYGNFSSISSKEAAYDGNALVLNGDVSLETGLGMMQSERARLIKQNKEAPFSGADLEDNVVISLKDKAQIFCGKAFLDLSSKMAHLLPKEGEKITFTSPTLKLTSQKGHVLFGEEDASSPSQIDVEEGVEIDYADGIHLSAAKAHYEKQEGHSAILAFPESDEGCRLTHSDGSLTAQEVVLKPEEKKVTLSHPKGQLFSQNQTGSMAISSDSLTWDHGQELLYLSGDVLVSKVEFGQMYAEQSMTIAAKEKEGKKEILSARSVGKTTLRMIPNHSLTSFGTFFFDKETMQITFDSPTNQDQVLEGQQVCYHTPNLEVMGNKGSLMLYELDGKWHPSELELEGSVRIVSPDAGRRCAVAEKLYYSPDARRLILEAPPGGKVLLWDQQKALSISADAIHISRDPMSGQEKVEGKGTVRFAFSKPEYAELKSLFPFFGEEYR